MKTILFYIFYFACLTAIAKIASLTFLQMVLILSFIGIGVILFALYEMKK
ncbi:MAG: hypothetical protein ACI3T9_05375 [Romboutsia timonensis]